MFNQITAHESFTPNTTILIKFNFFSYPLKIFILFASILSKEIKKRPYNTPNNKYMRVNIKFSSSLSSEKKASQKVNFCL